MFENILHQDRVVERLRHDVSKGAVPPSILFWGPDFSGKLSVALELSRALSCVRNARWDCSCRHCVEHRTLSHLRTLIAGNRNNISEIAACANLLQRDSSDGRRCLFLRSVRKLLRRFDSPLWVSEINKLSKIRSVIERLADTLLAIEPGKVLPAGKKLEKRLRELVRDCDTVSRVIPSILPVWQVRNMTRWAVQSVREDHKTVIVDCADRMTEASRNALLKFLEEPPKNTTAILIARRKTMIMPTILSRLRPYAFHARLPEQQKDILQRIFREEKDRWNGLADFFMAWRTSETSRGILSSAQSFIDKGRDGIANSSDLIAGIVDDYDLQAFLSALADSMRNNWMEEEKVDHKRLAGEAEKLNLARYRFENLNMKAAVVLKGLYYDLRVTE